MKKKHKNCLIGCAIVDVNEGLQNRLKGAPQNTKTNSKPGEGARGPYKATLTTKKPLLGGWG